ncbi:MAG: DEAD/DEAH box helicase [Sphaerochaetaceae bacterium]|jgi:ATP-dependent RNA helicase RhlB|nr:DEAD/DEAH box helicase [Sphaerochaetaceae bacterium]
MKFKELLLHADVMKGIDAAGFIDCMLVQEKVLPSALEGRDVMTQSKTGSGKTAVFLVAILQKYVLKREEAKRLPAEKANSVKLPLALIIAPTRELAVQIEDDAKLLASGISDFRIGCFYGGVGYAKQDKQIVEGVDLIIGTPGRILDYQQMGKLDFKAIDTFVVDEADRLFDMGFYPDIQKMFKMMVPPKRRQTMLFSATLGTRVRNLAWDYMDNPIEIAIQPEDMTVKEITQELYHVSKSEKFSLFLRLMAKENPGNALIFTNTKAKAIEVSKRLNVNGYTTQYLMGDLPQSKRLQVINRMKSGELRFLIATDVAARGLQIDDLELVVNYDIPEDFESYVHRIGRTARAGKSGKSITLACEQFVYGLEAIENYIQMKIPVVWVDEESVPLVEDKSARMRFRDLVNEREYASRGGHGASRSRRSGGQGRPSPRPRTTGRPRPAKNKVSPKSTPSGTFKPSPVRKEKSYNEIQKMNLDERIAYYKQVHGSGEPSSGPKSQAPKRGGRKPPQKPSRSALPQGKKPTSKGAPAPTKKKSTPAAKGKSAPTATKAVNKPQEKKPVPQKKQGVLSRFFKGKKGDA